MKALFCTDGSKISFDALANFSNWVNKNMEVDVICVIDWSYLPDSAVIEDSGFVKSCKNIADSIIDYSEQYISDLGLNFGKKIKHCGTAVESILETLDENVYDIVILGSNGKKGIQKWLGSVSREVLNASKISTFISKNKNSCGKILFTTDGSVLSKETVRKAFDIINLKDKEIHICTATEAPELLFLDGTMDPNWLLTIEKQQEITSMKALEDIENLFTERGFKITAKKTLKGHPANRIIDYAKATKTDLIVTGSKEKTKIQSFLLESVSKRIVENTNSDVIVIKL